MNDRIIKLIFMFTFANFENQNDKVSFKGTIGELAWLPFQKLI